MTSQRLARRTAYAAATGLVTAALAATPAATASSAAAGPFSFPTFSYVGTAFDKSQLKYNPTNEFIFPSIIRAADYFTNPLGAYYMYYAPHERPGGISLAYADSINGPWTEYPINPLISNTWLPNYNTVSHISSPHAIWVEGEQKLFLYFHGENSITRYATSSDGIHFEYGGTAVRQDASTGGETSYARVFEQSVPRLGSRYLMLFMDNPTAAPPGPTGPVSRRIRWAVSPDARNWTIQPQPIVVPQGDEGPNASGPFYLRWQGRNLVIFHAADGNMHAVDVGDNFDQEIHLGVVHDSMATAPDLGRSAAPTFYFDGTTVHMYYEAGGRLTATIGHAVATLGEPLPERQLDCTVDQPRLWPPNHRMVDVNVRVDLPDGVLGPHAFQLVDVAGGDAADVTGFVPGQPSLTGELRAERAGNGFDRVYTLTYRGHDEIGRPTGCTVTVTVPHDQGQDQ
ncbi:glycoside hydrolase family protein [Dactylosporangium darangshiense]|uniref:Secreted protein n=1 Tax=Dactylosporangium darangshiense TaxID=579108 RepID=A0ABP8DQD4_9ACTN